MTLQQEAARAAMIRWLANPAELGRPPKKCELAGEFSLHGMMYYIFRFKKSTFGRWLVGVSGGYETGSMEHCGHVFSEFCEYSGQTAQQHSIDMVESLRSYWTEQARAMNAQEQYYL